MRLLATILFLSSIIFFGCTAQKPVKSVADYDETLSKYQKYKGFFDFYYDSKTGKVFIEIENFDTDFLYVNYLSAGVGSNDIGLDRGQIGDTRIVRFERRGNKVLLLEPNLDFRAISDNREEVRSVDEAFAQSVLWGFPVEKESNGKTLIDLTGLLISDAHGVTQQLKRTKEGVYSVDNSRSAIYLDGVRNFQDNTELEAMITFTGTPSGKFIRSVTPTPESITVRMHHSFVRLPDDDYQPRKFDPRAGFYSIAYQDYASPIDTSLIQQFIVRHRLIKKNPEQEISEPVEPIVYYVDKGAPEPVRSALIEGASWWNEAFEAAGFENAFQVKVLPDTVDPLDIHYNVIQWVHRSTRGWSYGSSVVDPRTGEIIKGHVSLGSLRIRQDFLIATGLLQPYDGKRDTTEAMLEMALARLRQLSAHEVGHTLGLYHNFAASANNRASVMDYPHPNIQLTDGTIDLSNAYATGIGMWDKYAIRYGYTDFGSENNAPINDIIDEWISEGLQFITDADARPEGGGHAYAHLWDNGTNPASELKRLIEIRSVVLQNFSEAAIKPGQPLSSIEEVLVPMYFLHRYQIEAASKLIGGSVYTYKIRNDELPLPKPVSGENQLQAIHELSFTLTPDFLGIPKQLRTLLSPKVPGFPSTRESFKSRTGPTFDPVSVAESAAELTLRMLFNGQRLERLIQQNLENPELPGWSDLMKGLYMVSWNGKYDSGIDKEIQMTVEKRLFFHLLHTSINKNCSPIVQAMANQELEVLINRIQKWTPSDPMVRAHYSHTILLYERFRRSPDQFNLPKATSAPDGSPIGSDCMNNY